MREWIARLARQLRKNPVAFPLAVLAAGLMIVISEWGYAQASGRLAELVLIGQNRLLLTRMELQVSNAESAQRGYLLTRRPEYLAPFTDARRQAGDSLAMLQVLHSQITGPNDANMAALQTHVRTKLSEMDEVLRLVQAGRADTAQELLLTNIGRDEMVAIRAVVDRMLGRQNARVSIGLQDVFDMLSLNRLGVAAMTAISLLVLGMYLRQRRQADEERAQRQALVQAERDSLEMEVRHRTAELTALARHLETAREDERARLARDLHDELGALLTTAKLDAARMRPKLQQALPELAPRLAHLVETLNSGIALKRRIIEDLRPSSLSNLGLLPALEILCKEFGDRLDARMQVQLRPVALQPSGQLTAFRLVQEALTNVAKYAQATQVTVQLEVSQGQARLSVADDGQGFDPAQVGLSHHGLLGMRYRVEAEGGRLVVQASPGQGTRIEAWLPQHGEPVTAADAEV